MSKPPVFADLNYTSALDASRRQGKLLLLDATAVWCGPCKVMDRTAWIDPAVVDWIRQHAIAIQIDVDAEPATAKQLAVRAMLTVIAFKDGVEFDRAVGLKQPAELLSCLDGVMRGENSLVKLTAEAADRPDNMFWRMNLARALANAASSTRRRMPTCGFGSTCWSTTLRWSACVSRSCSLRSAIWSAGIPRPVRSSQRSVMRRRHSQRVCRRHSMTGSR